MNNIEVDHEKQRFFKAMTKFEEIIAKRRLITERAMILKLKIDELISKLKTESKPQ